MARELQHLELRRLQAPIPRQKHGGGGNYPRDNPARHAHDLLDAADTVIRAPRRRPPALTANPQLIFKLRLAPKGNLDEETLGRFGLTMLARDPQKTLVVFSSQADLALFKERVTTYGSPTGFKFGEVGTIETLEPIDAADRTGRRLTLHPITPDDVDVPVDVELWHPGSQTSARARLDELKAGIADAGGRYTDELLGNDLLLARCHIDAALLDEMLHLDIVREVDAIPAPSLERLYALGTQANNLPEILDAPDDATGVLLLDTGITANHPLLRPSVGDAQVFPESLGSLDGTGASDPNGHGTRVAGFAAWGSPHTALAQTPMQAQVAVFSGRVLDVNGRYDPDQLLEQQLNQAIEYFLSAYPQCRVINLSLGDDRLVFAPSQRQSRLAARLDEIAYELQARNVLFIISTGNYSHQPATDAEHITDYPHYLLKPPAGLIEPATAALALTVGGLTAGGRPQRTPTAPGRRGIADAAEYPSPFTRTGPGVDAMIKPDFVELAGDLAYDPAGRNPLGHDPGLGLPTTNRDFAPPNGQLLCADVGTSFAAPAVAHAAALLYNDRPDATPNLIRALLADSAHLPTTRPDPLKGDAHTSDVLRTYGHGRPNAERALRSADNDVLLLRESSIAIDSFELFEIPVLPPDFLAKRGERQISVSLAFDPPTRQTRGDSYLGVTMQMHLFRNSSLQAVASAFGDWKAAPPADPQLQLEQQLEKALGDIPSRQKIELKPGAQLRNRGTLQRGTAAIKRPNAWDYDGGPLILAISCLRKWAPAELSAQRYAVVASLKHDDPTADLHAPLLARLQTRQRERVRPQR